MRQFTDKVDLDEFIEYDDSKEVLADFDPALLNERYGNTIYRQLMDAWGEANHSIEIWKDVKKHRSNKRSSDLLAQLKAFHKICCLIYSNPNVDFYTKKTLKIAEWEIYDFTLWDNNWGNNAKSVMRWFDQWCYSINYELIE